MGVIVGKAYLISFALTLDLHEVSILLISAASCACFFFMIYALLAFPPVMPIILQPPPADYATSTPKTKFIFFATLGFKKRKPKACFYNEKSRMDKSLTHAHANGRLQLGEAKQLRGTSCQA